jgi:branched-chain amino acid transport system permease protein
MTQLGVDGALTTLMLVCLVLAPPVCLYLGSPFWMDVINRVMILALAAASLSLLISLAGLVSFGHSVFMGIGGYTIGILATHGIENGYIQLFVALVISALVAFISGLVALRTRGVHFIMITLAFCQMVYFVMVGLREYGGDDGLTINIRSEFPRVLNLDNKMIFFYTTLALFALSLWLISRIRASRFGLVLNAAKGSERRVAATGFDPFMVILGGVGTISGPFIGAVAFVVIEELLGSVTVYWHFWFGLFLVAVVMFARGGIVGVLSRRK